MAKLWSLPIICSLAEQKCSEFVKSVIINSQSAGKQQNLYTVPQKSITVSTTAAVKQNAFD